MLVPTLVVSNEFVQNLQMKKEAQTAASVTADSTIGTVSPWQQWVETLSQTLHEINSGADMNSLFAGITESACRLLGLDMCSLLVADEGEERLLVAGSCGLSLDYVQLVNGTRPITLLEQGPTYSSPSAQAYLTRSLVLIPDASQSSDFFPWRDMARDEGYESLIAAPLANHGPALGVLVGYGRSARRYTSEQINGLELLARFASTALITARLRADSREMIGELHRTNRELLERQRQTAEQDFQHDELMRAVASDIGVGGVISTLARLLQVPVCLQDRFGTTLAEERLHHSDASLRQRDDFMSSHLHTIPMTEDSSHYLSRIHTTVRPIILDAKPVATLWVGPAGSRHEPVSEQLLDRFGLAVALELAKALPMERARHSLARDVVTQLLSAEDLDQREAAAQRALALDFDLSEPLQMALVDWCHEVDQPVATIVDFLEARGTNASHPILVGNDGRRAVVLIQGSPEQSEAFFSRSFEHLQGTTSASSIHAVVAGTAQGVRDLGRLHQGLTGAMALLPKSTGWTTTYVDLGSLTGLLLTHGSPDALKSFANSILTPVIQGDRGSEIYATLRVWLNSQCSVAATAAAMHLHPNTVKYRLKKIENLLGKELKDPENLTELCLAMDIDLLTQVEPLSN